MSKTFLENLINLNIDLIANIWEFLFSPAHITDEDQQKENFVGLYFLKQYLKDVKENKKQKYLCKVFTTSAAKEFEKHCKLTFTSIWWFYQNTGIRIFNEGGSICCYNIHYSNIMDEDDYFIDNSFFDIECVYEFLSFLAINSDKETFSYVAKKTQIMKFQYLSDKELNEDKFVNLILTCLNAGAFYFKTICNLNIIPYYYQLILQNVGKYGSRKTIRYALKSFIKYLNKEDPHYRNFYCLDNIVSAIIVRKDGKLLNEIMTEFLPLIRYTDADIFRQNVYKLSFGSTDYWLNFTKDFSHMDPKLKTMYDIFDSHFDKSFFMPHWF